MTDITPWWSRAVFYQVYPRSFADSNGDGVGDSDGVAAKLDYLTLLGVDAIWLNPVTVSPMVDHGYDVADPRDVDPLFGDLDALDALIVAAHQRDIKVTMDLVPNHTSSQHPWFAGRTRRRARVPPSASATSFATGSAATARCRRTTGCRCSAGRPGPG